MTWTETIEQYLREGRSVSGGKGDHSSAEQQNADNQRQMETQLMQQELGMFQKQLNQVNAVVNPMIAHGGFAPGVQTAMTNQALNGMGEQFRAGVGQMNQDLVARGMTGGPMAGSGGVAQGFGALNALQAGLQTNALNNIQLQKQQALMGDLGLKLGIGGMYGSQTQGFNQGAGQALGSGVTAANNADQASNAFWGSLMGALTSPFSVSAKV